MRNVLRQFLVFFTIERVICDRQMYHTGFDDRAALLHAGELNTALLFTASLTFYGAEQQRCTVVHKEQTQTISFDASYNLLCIC